MKKQEWLYEISFMRPVLLVLLVSYHAFAPYCGAWSLPEGVDTNLILLIGCNCLIEYNSLFIPDSSLYTKAILFSVNTILKVVLATTGIITLFLIASKYMQHHSLSDTIIQIGTLGYGVYIFHQFVLRWLYYHTSISEVLGGVWLPWIGLISAVGISILLTILIHRTKIGRKLI